MSDEPSPDRAVEDASEGLAEAYRDLVGRDLGEYHVERVIGHGSMGVVYEARHRTLERRVALKVLPPRLGIGEKTVQRFLREAQQVAQLDHEHVVKIYDIGESEGIHFFAMQLLDGQSLDRILKSHGAMTPEEAARITYTAARAVHFAHQQGIIHRDIKPGNILQLKDGRVVLTDFGLARPERGASLTDSGAMVGTPLYMSPEQIQAHREGVDRRTDIYSLGATLYELASGSPPHHGESTQEILRKILDEEPQRLRKRRRSVPRDLEIVALKALEKDRRSRYLTAGDMAKDLQRFLEGEPVLARRAGYARRCLRRMRKHRTVSLLSVGVLALLLISVLMIFVIDDALQTGQNEKLQGLLEQGRARLNSQLYVDAETCFREATAIRPDDDEAQLGLARSLLELGRVWSEQRASKTLSAASDAAWSARFGTPSAAFIDGIERINGLTRGRSQPPAQALLCRAGLHLQLALETTRSDNSSPDVIREEFGKCLRDLSWSDRQSRKEADADSWATQQAVASLRYSFATESSLDPLLAEQVLEQSLGNASCAIRMRLEHHPPEREPRILSRLHGDRSRILRRLFEEPMASSERLTPAKIELYLEVCETEAARAIQLWRGNELAANIVRWAREIRKSPDVATPSNLVGQTTDDPRTPGSFLSDFTALLTQPSDTARIFEEMLDERVDPLLKIGENETIREFTSVLAAGLIVDSGATPAETVDQAREGLVAGVLMRRNRYVSSAVAETCLGLLQQVLERTPDHALLHHEAAYLYRKLGRWDQTLEAARRAVDCAPDNPLFRYSLTTLLAQRTLRLRRDAGGSAPDAAAELIDQAHEHLAEAVTLANMLLKQYQGVVTFSRLASELAQLGQ